MSTPFQEEVSRLIASYEETQKVKMTGRLLGELTHRSRNHLSNIMNDGLVPSAEAVSAMCHVLGATPDAYVAILMAAMRTKSEGPRKLAWLEEAMTQIDRLQQELSHHAAFIEEKGLMDEFRQRNKETP